MEMKYVVISAVGGDLNLDSTLEPAAFETP